MIHYVISTNPDDRVLQRATYALSEGGLIAFPTDSSWVIAASPMSKVAVERLYKLKNVDHHKHFSLLCNTIAQASRYAFISDAVYKRIRNKLPGPYTFVFTPTNDLPRSIRDYKKEKEIGIRIPASVLAARLVDYLKQPLLATSISKHMIPELAEEEAEESWPAGKYDIYSYQIEEALGHLLAMIIDPGDFEFKGPSSVVDFSKDPFIPVILREGIGEIESFL